MKKSWKRDCNIRAALLKLLLVFASLKCLCEHFITRISFTNFSPNSQNILFFYCGSGKMHEDEVKLVAQTFLVGTWGEMVAL